MPDTISLIVVLIFWFYSFVFGFGFATRASRRSLIVGAVPRRRA